jgi:hypothetical protein
LNIASGIGVNTSMKDLIRLLATAVVGILLAGCIVVATDDSPPVVEPPSPEAATRAEIDAAGNLGFDNSRVAALNTIAGRANLSQSAQVHLVKTVFRRLTFDNNQMTVLRTLIANESFSNAAKQTLLAQMSKLHFESSKSALLQLISDRGELKA